MADPAGRAASFTDPAWQAEGAIAVADLKAAIAAAKDWISATPSLNAIILFGGGQIYEMGMALCNRIELTVIEQVLRRPDTALFPALDEHAGSG